MGGKQAADVITIVKDNQLKREGKEPLTEVPSLCSLKFCCVVMLLPHVAGI